MANLGDIRLRPGDEAIVADNTPGGIVADLALPAGWRVEAARGEGSPARARNAGALAARGDWLLFVDSDCQARPDLVERHVRRVPPDDCAIVGGAVVGAAGQSALVARYARTHNHLEGSVPIAHPFLVYVLPGNALVRRSAWRSLGGFLDGILDAEGVDFAWRAQGAGWSVAFNGDAVVEREHPESARALWHRTIVTRAGAVWMHRRWPEADLSRVPWPAMLARSTLAAPALLLAGRRDLAAMKLLDTLVAAGILAGRLRSNRAHEWTPRTPSGVARVPVHVWCDRFPVVSETFVVNETRELETLGHSVQVRAAARPEHPTLGVHDVRVRYLEDDTRLERAAALVRLVARHPLRCLRDRLGHRRWARHEPPARLRELAPAVLALEREPGARIHVHFAAGMALSAMRASRIAGRPWSLTAHAYDIYLQPANLAEKLRAAQFVTSGCDYTVRDLAAIAGPGRVHKIIMGVDPELFRRSMTHVDRGTVIAIGRLVEKKGFLHLVRAAADPVLLHVLERLVIVGDGPLRGALEAEARRLGIAERVHLAGRLEVDEIRAGLESAAVLAMPCVVAADGDRDSMPVVVKEAMAMETPVVVTDEVGLPELVRPEFGRVVAPADPHALAVALAELLTLPADRRAAMGRAARVHVIEHAHVRAWTARLSDLLEAASRRT